MAAAVITARRNRLTVSWIMTGNDAMNMYVDEKCIAYVCQLMCECVVCGFLLLNVVAGNNVEWELINELSIVRGIFALRGAEDYRGYCLIEVL